MIFTNPSGAPELACDECGCRWFDRMSGSCYECGVPVPEPAREAFRLALLAYAGQRQEGRAPALESEADRWR